MTPKQKKIMIGLGLISIVLGGSYYAYVKISELRKNKNTNEKNSEDGKS